MTAPSSPCVNHCVLDDATQTCLGCGRTSAQISLWSTLTERERLTIMAQIACLDEALTSLPESKT